MKFRLLFSGNASCDRVALPNLRYMLDILGFHNPPNSDMDYVSARDGSRGCADTQKRVCTESGLWEKNPLLHRGIEPASAACRSEAQPTELHPP